MIRIGPSGRFGVRHGCVCVSLRGGLTSCIYRLCRIRNTLLQLDCFQPRQIGRVLDGCSKRKVYESLPFTSRHFVHLGYRCVVGCGFTSAVECFVKPSNMPCNSGSSHSSWNTCWPLDSFHKFDCFLPGILPRAIRHRKAPKGTRWTHILSPAAWKSPATLRFAMISVFCTAVPHRWHGPAQGHCPLRRGVLFLVLCEFHRSLSSAFWSRPRRVALNLKSEGRNPHPLRSRIDAWYTPQIHIPKRTSRRCRSSRYNSSVHRLGWICRRFYPSLRTRFSSQNPLRTYITSESKQKTKRCKNV